MRLSYRWLTMKNGIVSDVAAEGPWRLTRGEWLASLIRTARGAVEDDYGMVASAIAFSSFLALLPLLSAIGLVYGMTTTTDRVAENVHTLLFILPIEARAFIGNWLIDAITRRDGREFGLLIAMGVTVLAALRAGRSIIGGLNVASGINQPRTFIRRRIVALLIVFCGAGLILGALFAISALAWIEHALPPDFTAILPALRAGFWTLAAVACGGTLTLVYRYAPHRPPPRRRWILPGAAAATMLWLAATVAFGVYLGNFGTTHQTYGSVGAIVVLQLWLFLSGFVLLLGAKLNSELMRSANVKSSSNAG
jgi:membrane protein